MAQRKLTWAEKLAAHNEVVNAAGSNRVQGGGSGSDRRSTRAGSQDSSKGANSANGSRAPLAWWTCPQRKCIASHGGRYAPPGTPTSNHPSVVKCTQCYTVRAANAGVRQDDRWKDLQALREEIRKDVEEEAREEEENGAFAPVSLSRSGKRKQRKKNSTSLSSTEPPHQAGGSGSTSAPRNQPHLLLSNSLAESHQDLQILRSRPRTDPSSCLRPLRAGQRRTTHRRRPYWTPPR